MRSRVFDDLVARSSDRLAKMCTILVWNGLSARFPLVVAANRDEFLDRPTTPPVVLNDRPRVVGGRDEVAGGTWLALSECNFVVAVTNRRDGGEPDARKRSRGRLVLDLATASDLRAVRQLLALVDPLAYNPFILLAADARTAVAMHAGSDGLTIAELPPGAHAITNWRVDASEPPRAAAALAAALRLSPVVDDPRAGGDDPVRLADQLRCALADHGESTDEALCIHRESDRYGTRSSSVVLISADPTQTRYFHLEGPPCGGQFADQTARLGIARRGRPA
ncbi:MAG: NRDE family protein [Vulcanimicrobiaceae bacterium]